ncbi:MAG: hypothetical protein LBH32_03605 [Dysgonamonadaceae bacterium]|jgi:hypothetical protein|nr:hypothetical protein [Dysgonamonadaceae bacterium]
MKIEDHVFKELRDSLAAGKESNLHVLEINVPIDKQLEYFRYADGMRNHCDVDEDIDEHIDIINSPNTNKEDMKFSMVILAISGDVKAFRALEDYNKNCNNSLLKDWAAMSLLQAKIILESELSDNKQIFISTGLGGEGRRIRFFAFFKSSTLEPFSDYQRKLIEKEMSFYINKYDGILEEQKIEDNYFTMLFLLDIIYNVGCLLSQAVEECNQFGDFISNNFIISNVKLLDEKDIAKELEKLDE